MVSLLKGIEDNIVLSGLLCLFDGLVASRRIIDTCGQVSVALFGLTFLFKVRKSNKSAILKPLGKVSVEYLLILFAEEAVLEEEVEVKMGNRLQDRTFWLCYLATALLWFY